MQQGRLPSTAKTHLTMFADVPEAKTMCDLLQTLRSVSKTKSTFVDGFLRHVRADGRPDRFYMLFHDGFNDDEDDESGTTTGRLIARDPAFQTPPKKTKWAECPARMLPGPGSYCRARLRLQPGRAQGGGLHRPRRRR